MINAGSIMSDRSSAFAGFDRSYLPEVDFEFVVISDTHYTLDPEPYAVEFASVREWPLRVEWSLQLAASVGASFVVHLGDLTEENPANEVHLEARSQACAQLERCGVKPYHVAGNVDIGDKPDATMWSEAVTPETLALYHERFGRSSSNPRSAFGAVRCLNTILFGAREDFGRLSVGGTGPHRVLGIEGESRRHWLILPRGPAVDPASLDALDCEGEISIVDLVRGTSRSGVEGRDELSELVAGIGSACLVSAPKSPPQPQEASHG